MSQLAGPSSVLARLELVSPSQSLARKARLLACPLCSRRYATTEPTQRRGIRDRLRGWFEEVSAARRYDPVEARRRRLVQERQEADKTPFFVPKGRGDADAQIGRVYDKGVLIPPERLWQEPKVLKLGDQRPGEHRFITPLLARSPKDLMKIAFLIRRRPVEEALLQLQFLQKRFAPLLRDELHKGYVKAVERGFARQKLIVDEMFCSKTANTLRKLDFKAFGRAGFVRKKTTRVTFVLKEGDSPEELEQKELNKALRRRLRKGSAMPNNRDTRMAVSYEVGKKHRW